MTIFGLVENPRASLRDWGEYKRQTCRMSAGSALRSVPILILFALFNSLGSQAQTVAVGSSVGKWQSVSLPFRPVNIAGVGSSFWVCGADEMIARSDDNAQTWHLKHHTENGEVLLTISFLGERTGYAAGTNGIILWTKDGGETWASMQAGSENIFM